MRAQHAWAGGHTGPGAQPGGNAADLTHVGYRVLPVLTQVQPGGASYDHALRSEPDVLDVEQVKLPDFEDVPGDE